MFRETPCILAFIQQYNYYFCAVITFHFHLYYCNNTIDETMCVLMYIWECVSMRKWAHEYREKIYMYLIGVFKTRFKKPYCFNLMKQQASSSYLQQNWKYFYDVKLYTW